jgi:colanic acid/amylovoran biosynthesis protein
VPTIAIAYSQKARGICRDLFGNEDYLLTTSRLSTAALLEAWERLVANELTVREVLEQKRQDMLQGARRNAEALAHVLGRCHLRHEEN